MIPEQVNEVRYFGEINISRVRNPSTGNDKRNYDVLLVAVDFCFPRLQVVLFVQGKELSKQNGDKNTISNGRLYDCRPLTV